MWFVLDGMAACQGSRRAPPALPAAAHAPLLLCAGAAARPACAAAPCWGLVRPRPGPAWGWPSRMGAIGRPLDITSKSRSDDVAVHATTHTPPHLPVTAARGQPREQLLRPRHALAHRAAAACSGTKPTSTRASQIPRIALTPRHSQPHRGSGLLADPGRCHTGAKRKRCFGASQGAPRPDRSRRRLTGRGRGARSDSPASFRQLPRQARQARRAQPKGTERSAGTGAERSQASFL
jgi:hypothetical protein